MKRPAEAGLVGARCHLTFSGWDLMAPTTAIHNERVFPTIAGELRRVNFGDDYRQESIPQRGRRQALSINACAGARLPGRARPRGARLPGSGTCSVGYRN